MKPPRLKFEVIAKEGGPAKEKVHPPRWRISRVISTVRKHRRHSTRSSSRGISDSRRCWIGIQDLPEARGSDRTESHHPFGGGASGAGSGCARAIELLTATLPDLDTGEVRDRLSSKKGFVWLKREITPLQQQDSTSSPAESRATQACEPI
jgi:hypothetical protein